MQAVIESVNFAEPVEPPMLTYPKMENLFSRDEKTNKYTDQYKMKEFGSVRHWHVEEKIHGQNIRVQWNGKSVKFAGRKSERLSDLPKDLVTELERLFPVDKLISVFGEGPQRVTIFGEGYGAGINGGANYSATKKFLLFDVNIDGTFLSIENRDQIAGALGIKTPYVFKTHFLLSRIESLVSDGFMSPLAEENGVPDHPAEGIIARTEPRLFNARGERVIFKLKTHDFAR